MTENKDYVAEEQTHEQTVKDAPTPQSIQSSLLEEIRGLKALIQLLTSKLDDSNKEDITYE